MTGISNMVDINDDFGLRLLRAWEDVQKTANRATPFCEATSSSGNNSKLMESALRRSYRPSAGEPQQQQAMPLRHASGEPQQDHEEPMPLLSSDALLLPPRRAMNLSSKLLGTGARPNGRSLPAAEISSSQSASGSNGIPWDSPRRKILTVSKSLPVPPLSLPPPAAMRPTSTMAFVHSLAPCSTDSANSAALLAARCDAEWMQQQQRLLSHHQGHAAPPLSARHQQSPDARCHYQRGSEDSGGCTLKKKKTSRSCQTSDALCLVRPGRNRTALGALNCKGIITSQHRNLNCWGLPHQYRSPQTSQSVC